MSVTQTENHMHVTFSKSFAEKHGVYEFNGTFTDLCRVVFEVVPNMDIEAEGEDEAQDVLPDNVVAIGTKEDAKNG